MELTGPPNTIRNAKRLRREITLPEILLWQALRTRPVGLKFRKQHPAGPYVLDFYCDAVRLAVEVDGAAHGHGDRPTRDAERDAWLRLRNVRVLRIAAADVLAELEAVVRQIIDTARG